MATPAIPKHTMGCVLPCLCTHPLSQHCPCSPGDLPSFHSQFKSHLLCEVSLTVLPHPGQSWEFSASSHNTMEPFSILVFTTKYLITSFLTVSLLGCELLKSEDIFPSCSTMPGHLTSNQEVFMEWMEADTNVLSMDFPTLPHTWKHVNPTWHYR